MKPISAHRKETFLFLGGAFLLLLVFFGGIVLFRMGVLGGPLVNTEPTKDVNQIVFEMNTTQTAIAEQVNLFITATSVALTANAPTPTPEPQTGSSRISPVDGMEQVYVPSGKFLMGSTDQDHEAELQEKPQHTVYLSGYWIDKTLVTQAMYIRCIAAGLCPDVVHDEEQYPEFGKPEFQNHPIVYVTWDAAKSYCEKVGRRLPTEAEWEKAARGPNGQEYPWGNAEPNETLALFGNALPTTNEVGRFPAGASPYGVLDMVGNVRQWVFDVFSEYYYGDEMATNNPQGPELSKDHPARVLRGASYKDSLHYLHAAMRFKHVPNSPGENRGFRCASSN